MPSVSRAVSAWPSRWLIARRGFSAAAAIAFADNEIADMLKAGFEHAQQDMERRALKEQQVEAERVIEATEQALAIDASLLDEAERTALDAAIAALRSAAQGQDSRAIKIQLEAFNRASNEFASRRMDKSIRQALAGHKIDEIRI